MELLHPLVLVTSAVLTDTLPFQHGATECSNPRKRTEEDDTHTLPTSRRKCRDSRADEDLIEHLSQDETSRLDLDFEEWMLLACLGGF